MKQRFFKFENLEYVVGYPEGYEEGKKYPVILHLHGWSGALKNMTIEEKAKDSFFSCMSSRPFIVVTPLCPTRDMWFDNIHILRRFTVHLFNESFTDNERLYLMGASMGGYASWQLGMSLPEFFAAMVPICGGGTYWHAFSLARVPIWAHHGAKDQTVFVEESEKMVNAVNKNGGNARLTVYPDVEHASWVNVYENNEVFEWLLSNKNTRVGEALERIEKGDIK